MIRFAVSLSALVFSLTLVGAQENAAIQNKPATMEIILKEWSSSPHADASSESFTHWNNEEAVPEVCAACHSTPGFLDFVGADGSAAGQTDKPAPLGSVVACETCPNDAVKKMTSVVLPSGYSHPDPGSSASCMTCHQGRNSTSSLQAAINKVNGLDNDTVSDKLAFVNVHYRAAAATLLGSLAKGAYEYEGKNYAGRNNHVPQLATCTACHNPHSTKVEPALCIGCHKTEDLKAIRTTQIDVDGDGDLAEGISSEITTLHQRLGAAMRSYAAEIIGAPAIYAGSYPYFFNDTNGNGAADADEIAYPNRYNSWTPRLVRAAYNYQFVAVEPGAYTHNPHYVLQILYDSIENIADVTGSVSTEGLTRP
jgi:predicted CXXCH cytochrome family protein